jgi:hypothetical protein
MEAGILTWGKNQNLSSPSSHLHLVSPVFIMKHTQITSYQRELEDSILMGDVMSNLDVGR